MKAYIDYKGKRILVQVKHSNNIPNSDDGRILTKEDYDHVVIGNNNIDFYSMSSLQLRELRVIGVLQDNVEFELLREHI